MRALAEYVMTNRMQAILAAVFATATVFFAWIGGAVIALVVLRQGVRQGGYVLFWALLPAIFWVLWGDIGPLVTLIGSLLLASVLRLTASWSWALMAAVAFGLLTSVVLTLFAQGYLEQLVAVFNSVLPEPAPGSMQSMPFVPTSTLVAGMLGLSNTFTISVCLVLARWWQAVLYNPGGFRIEFHSLRLSPVLMVGLIIAGMAFASSGSDYQFWALIFAVPLMFAGFALIHAVVAIKHIGNNWLIVFYVCWLMLEPLKALLLIVVVVDSWLDIRKRLSNSDPQS